MDDPPCARCPMDLSTRPAPRKVPCRSCAAIRMSLYDLDSSELQVPDVSMADFRAVLTRSKPTVAKDELTRYEAWTKEFGIEGS